MKKILLISLLCFISGFDTIAQEVKTVIGEGEVAILGITPEKALYIAKIRARANAIEKAAGITVFSSTLVKDGKLIGEFIKTIAAGYIIEEKMLEKLEAWFDNANPPIPHYKVKLKAKVVVFPEKKRRRQFKASLNKVVKSKDKEKAFELIPDVSEFFNNDEAAISIHAFEDIYIGIFNITAKDRTIKLYPDSNMPLERIKEDEDILFSPSDFKLVITTLKGHKQDTEAFYIISVPAKKRYAYLLYRQFSKKEYEFADFFKRCAEIIEEILASEDFIPLPEILEYEVRKL